MLKITLLVMSGFILGWIHAGDEIALECKRQQGFYVGREDFKCELNKPTPNPPTNHKIITKSGEK